MNVRLNYLSFLMNVHFMPFFKHLSNIYFMSILVLNSLVHVCTFYERTHYVHFTNVHSMYIAVRTHMYFQYMFNSHSFYVYVWPDTKWTLYVRSLYIQCRLGYNKTIWRNQILCCFSITCAGQDDDNLKIADCSSKHIIYRVLFRKWFIYRNFANSIFSMDM